MHAGYDFPREIREEIESWGTRVRWVETMERETTRAVNEYGIGGESRAFRYTTAKVRVDETSLTDEMVLGRAFHMVCSPERCVSLVKGIEAERDRLGCAEDAIFVWEPVPDACELSALDAVREAARYVDVVSPNLAELSALFGKDEMEDEQYERMDERCVAILQGEFGDRGGAVVVRCGSRGCYLKSRVCTRQLPAYWTGSEAKEHVVDPTGGGNQFLGGLCMGLQSDTPEGYSRLERGGIFGNIAASFAVEQFGAPKLSKGPSGDELWNGVPVEERMRRYISRLTSLAP